MKPRVFELWQPEQVLQKPTAEADLAGGSSVPGSGAALGSGETPENSTYIDEALDDWTWCANPIPVGKRP